jgi:hypothetical protein
LDGREGLSGVSGGRVVHPIDNPTFGCALDSAKQQFLFPRTGASLLALQILVIADNLYECPNKIINCNNIQISTLVARLLKPFMVDRFGEIARGHLGKLQLGEML